MLQIGLGCWGLGSTSYGSVSEDEAKKILFCAYDSGIRFFDTAPLYGEGLSETRLGKYLPIDSEITIATKVGIVSDTQGILKKNLNTKNIIDSVENSLKRLKREYIDLVQLHSPELNFESDILFNSLFELINSGKVRKFGISLKTPKYLKVQHKLFPWASFQYNCSILDQRIVESHQLVNEYLSHSLKLIARTPLNFGFLTGQPPNIENLTSNHHLKNWHREQLLDWLGKRIKVIDALKGSDFNILAAALRFPIDAGLANIVIPGATTKSQLLTNIKAFSQPLPQEIIKNLADLFRDYTFERSPYTTVID
jgi:aryl-alcohol dehydrogenase-like predicted oxidoreductase